MTDSIIHDYVSNQRRLLELELRSEQEEEEQIQKSKRASSGNGNGHDGHGDDNEGRKSRILRNLEVEEWSIGLMGRTVVHLTSMTPGPGPNSVGNVKNDDGTAVPAEETTTAAAAAAATRAKKGNTRTKNNMNHMVMLPAHRITVGDEVEIMSKYSYNNEKMLEGQQQQQQQQHQQRGDGRRKRKKSGGVVSAVTDTMISVALFGNPQQNTSTSTNAASATGTGGGRGRGRGGGGDDVEEESQILGSPPLVIVPKSSVEVHKKMVNVLKKLEQDGEGHIYAGRVIRNIFHSDYYKESKSATDKGSSESDNGIESSSSQHPFTPFNSNLDGSQLDAIKFCLQNQPISLIHGPPGTGKTTTVAELILQAVHVHKLRVLVTAPSNVAVDNVLERLVSYKPNGINENNGSGKKNKRNNGGGSSTASAFNENKIRAVRLGHPARIQSSILNYSLEALVQKSDGTDIVKDIRAELQSYVQFVNKSGDPKKRKTKTNGSNYNKNGSGNSKHNKMDKRTAYREIKTLRKEIRQREEKVVQSLMANAQVVLATNVGAASYILDRYEKSSSSKPFDLVIIDEAAQALEVSCWIPILRGKRVVLAGDHCQLPPTIKSSNQEVQKGLSKTMFERIMEHGQVSRMLKIQYRMHQDIANWASEKMYHGQLLSHESVKARKLHHLSHVHSGKPDPLEEEESTTDALEGSMLPCTSNATLLLIDTAGCDMFESVNAAGSRYNEGEASVVERHVRNLLQIGLRESDIAIITPYNGQVEILKNLLLIDFPKLEIRSVDGFQGGEREAVVLSLVRSSDRNGADGIGFLRDKRRLNVAITRAKRQCAVICDTDTVSQNYFLKGLVDWMEEKGEYFSAMEYTSDELQNNGAVPNLELPNYPNKNVASKTISKNNYKSRKSSALDQAMVEKLSSLDVSNKKDVQKNTVDKGLSQVMPESVSSLTEAHVKESVNKAADKYDGEINTTSLEISENDTTSDIKCNTDIVADNCNKPTTKDKIPDRLSSYPESEGKTENINSLLGALAKERQVRAQAQQQQQQQQQKTVPKKVAKKKKSKKGGKKLGGAKPKEIGEPKIEDDDLDDLAFLDAQIEKVQNSHGRKVEGTGKGYKSIVNGILLAKPKSQEKKKDVRAAGALTAKIKEAQTNRKPKSKKK